MKLVSPRFIRAVKEFGESLAPVEIGSFEDAIRFYTGNSETVKPVEADKPVQDVKPVEDSEADSVWLASKLRLEVAKDKRPKIHRAFAIWATLPDKETKNHWLVSDVVSLYAEEMNLCQREIYRIVNADNDFWTIHHGKYLQFHSKQRVYDAYGLVKPGVSQLVPIDGLLGSLKSLRYWLQAGIFNGRKTANITREQIQEETGFDRHQQLSYEAEVNAHKLPQFVYDPKEKDPEKQTKQTCNRYVNPNPQRRKQRSKQYGIRVGNVNSKMDSSIRSVKSFYTLCKDAMAKAMKLDRQNRERLIAYLKKENSNYALYYTV